MSVILYSTNCPKCNVLKKKLDQHNVTYSINDSVEEMESLGIEDVPVLSLDGQLMDFKEAVVWINNN